MNNWLKFGIAALLLVSLIGSAIAFESFGNEKVKAALESGDYAAWKQAMTDDFTEERFDQMRERQNDMVQNKIKMEEKKAEIDAAMDKGYDTWLAAIGNDPREAKLKEKITAENFDKFVAMHKAIESGDHDAAKQLAEELGIERLGGRDPRGPEGRNRNCQAIATEA